MTNAEYQTNRIAQGASLLASLNEVIQEHCREQGVETAFALRDALIDMHKADNTLRGYRAENMTESTMAVIGPIHGSEGTDMDAAYSQLSGPRFLDVDRRKIMRTLNTIMFIALLGFPAVASTLLFSTGNPDGRIGTLSRPGASEPRQGGQARQCP